MAAEDVSDVGTFEAGLLKKRNKGKVQLYGSVPIPAIPLKVVPGGVVPSNKAEISLPNVAEKQAPSVSGSKRKVMRKGEVFWSDILDEFEGEEDVKFLWDKRFLVNNLVWEWLLTQKIQIELEVVAWIKRASLCSVSL